MICFPHSAAIICFPALRRGSLFSHDQSCWFSRVWQKLHVFARLAAITYFPALGTSCVFSRAWHRLHVFSRLAAVPSFSRAWHQFYVFKFSAAVPCFPRAWHQFYVFTFSAAVSCFPVFRASGTFPALGTSYRFPHAQLQFACFRVLGYR